MKVKLQRKQLPKFKARPKESHKYDYGNVYIFGGSIGFLGAPQLSALAAYRCGSGLVHIVVPNDLYKHFPHNVMEVMVHPYRDLQEIGYLISKADAILFGPGLNPYDDTQREVLKVLLESKKPLIIDASGLGFIKPLLDEISDGSNIILTPHMGEAKELVDDEEPLRHLDPLLKKKMTLVVKGSETHVITNHKHFVAAEGNPGMATAGSGDVLAGMILSYAGQGHNLLTAALTAVYLHQRAGGYAKEEQGEDSMMASDIIQHIGQAIRSIKK